MKKSAEIPFLLGRFLSKSSKQNATRPANQVRKSYMTTSSKYRSSNRYKGRFSIPGAYYHIIICTHQRQKILANNTAASIIFSTFDWLEAENRIEWICIMVLSRNGALWQKGYTDWGIRTETVLNKTIRYCYTNPIRTGIVASSRDYPYWRCKFEME